LEKARFLGVLGISVAFQAAVVQYTPCNDVTKTPVENMMRHASDVAGWTNAVREAATLVVFPELTLGFNCTSRDDAAIYGVVLPGNVENGPDVARTFRCR
jgi:predicted amidohydrolase